MVLLSQFLLICVLFQRTNPHSYRCRGLYIDVSGTPPRPLNMTVFFTIDTPLGFAVFPCEGNYFDIPQAIHGNHWRHH